MILRGCLKGHNGWVTSIAVSEQQPDTIVTSSRDHTCLVWKLQPGEAVDEPTIASYCGVPKRVLKGHSNIVEEVDLSRDGQYALTASWDGTLRLWNVETGKSDTTFVGHKKDVLSVCFSPDNRLIISGGRDRTIKLWNTIGECQYTLDKQGHDDWVSCVRFLPNMDDKPRLVSCGYDKIVKVWDLVSMKVEYNLIGHTQLVNKLSVSPDGKLCASAGKDGLVIIWDLERGEEKFRIQCDEAVNDVCISPASYTLAIATTKEIILYDMENETKMTSYAPEFIINPKSKALIPRCTCISWSVDGASLFAGYTDFLVRVIDVRME